MVQRQAFWSTSVDRVSVLGLVILMATVTRRKRYKSSEYREDPNLGLTIDVGSMDAELFDDPIRLLQWLSESEDIESTQATSANATEKKQSQTSRQPTGGTAEKRKPVASIPPEAPLEVKYLLRRSIRCIDFRRRGGALWVIGDDDITPTIKKLMSCGMVFHYKEEGSTATNYKPAWWTKSSTPDSIERVYEDIDTKLQTEKQPTTQGGKSTEKKAVKRAAKQTNSPQVMALIGILAGVSCDGRVNEEEARTVKAWLDNIDCSSDARLIAVRDLIERCLEDDVITPEEEAEMLELFNKITTLAQDALFTADSEAPSSLKDYIEENLTCEKCGSAMKLVKTRKFFLGCTQCEETRLLTPDDVDAYIDSCSVGCPECGGAIHGAVSRYGIYVRCENKHNISVDAI